MRIFDLYYLHTHTHTRAFLKSSNKRGQKNIRFTSINVDRTNIKTTNTHGHTDQINIQDLIVIKIYFVSYSLLPIISMLSMLE